MPGQHVRAAIASYVLGPIGTPEHLGDVTLHAHQREGADRAMQLVRTVGGALVADDVGLGKTFLALAVARGYRRPLVLAPAALRRMWADACARTHIHAHFASCETVARREPDSDPDFVIVDEAHHLRNPATRRFAAARVLCANVPVLLLSATPVQNRIADLRVIMSLFLGARAHALTAGELATMIVRREASEIGPLGAVLPVAAAPLWLHPRGDADCLERLLALPPPMAPADAGDGGVLLTYTLIRQWASSRAALVNALRRRVARAYAIEDALADGHVPSRAELGAWCFAGDSQQIALAFMAAGPQQFDATRLADQVRAHRTATCGALDWLATTTNPDESRADLLQAVARKHRGRRVVAFSEYAETVEAMYRLLVPRLRVAMLTHSGGRSAGGRIARDEILDRFAPGSAVTTPERERIDVLLTTDVLSEGVSLHDASVIVHLDLPWNPARLAQRVGRVRRIGSPEERVIVYAMAPPTPAERMLELEGRLRSKLATAARAVGVTTEVLPGLATVSNDSSTSTHQALVAAIEKWRQADCASTENLCGAMRSSRNGFLACVRLNGRVRFVGGTESVSEDPMELAALARCAGDESAAAESDDYTVATSTIHAWLRRQETVSTVESSARLVARTRRAVLQRVDYISRRIPRHDRPGVTPMLIAARHMAAARLSAGAEQQLDDLARASLSDSAWLQAIGEFARLHARPSVGHSEIVALLLLRRPV